MPKYMEKIDIAVLKTQVKELQTSVDKILDNHLPHIQDRLDTIDNRQAKYAGGLAVLTVVIPILINIFFK